MSDFEPRARVIADSVTVYDHRLTTIEVRMHRFVLAEFNTHRVFSRNSASSRAIPVAKTMARLADEPALPLSWPAEKPGMQGGDELDPDLVKQARDIWLSARDAAVGYAEELIELGVHKSVVNRLLEPFMSHAVIVSATDFDGFFTQRCSPLAQSEIRAAADVMRAAYDESIPSLRVEGQYHLPYIGDELVDLGLEAAKRISVARCARVSYLTHDGKRDVEADLNLYDRLVTADPPHASPLEHVATPCAFDQPSLGNFTGWRQLRHEVLGI